MLLAAMEFRIHMQRHDQRQHGHQGSNMNRPRQFAPHCDLFYLETESNNNLSFIKTYSHSVQKLQYFGVSQFSPFSILQIDLMRLSYKRNILIRNQNFFLQNLILIILLYTMIQCILVTLNITCTMAFISSKHIMRSILYTRIIHKYPSIFGP